LAADLEGATAILVQEEKNPSFAAAILTLITLGPVGLLARLDHFGALTVGTLYRDRDHRHPPRPVVIWTDHTRKLLIWNITRLIGSSEAERLTFVALAQHVLSCRAKNEGGLFRHLLKQKRYQCVTQADEDAALRRLKQHWYGRG
jgi:hypothetical protein